MDQSQVNRAILLTPPGGAAIAVIRVLGPGVGDFLHRHFSREPQSGRCVHGELRDGERIIDDPVVAMADDAAWVDLNVHGGPWVVRSTLDLLLRSGFDVIESPGLPLPPEAVDGSDDLERAALAALPLARTELGMRALLAQPHSWRRAGLAQLLFPSLAAPLARRDPHADPRRNCEKLASILADRALYHLLHPPRVAVVGMPNVGKSTLANQLFAQERSITADLPGTTRDWVGEMADVNGLPVMLLDTPGQRATDDPIEAAAIARSAGEIAAAELVLLVLDPTQPLAPEQSALMAGYPNALIVINKADRQPVWDLKPVDAIHTVATTGEGIDRLRRAIAAVFGVDQFDLARPRWWTLQQHAALVDLRLA